MRQGVGNAVGHLPGPILGTTQHHSASVTGGSLDATASKPTPSVCISGVQVGHCRRKALPARGGPIESSDHHQRQSRGMPQAL
jgi:hypothetical protein